MKTLNDAITQFKKQIKKTDYDKVKGNQDYLSVAYRLKFCREFFGDRLQIHSESFETSNGSHKFVAKIIIDKQCLAMGESKQMHNKEKDFEKSQTVAIGRGLAFLGFMGDEIASKEEMDQFNRTDEIIANKKTTNPVVQSSDDALKKINTQKFAKEWIEKLKTQATLSASVHKFEQGIQVLSKEYAKELDQLYKDPIEDVRVANEYTKLKTEIQNRKTNGR